MFPILFEQPFGSASNMTGFPASCNNNGPFAGPERYLRLFNEFVDKEARAANGRSGTFNPRFDVRETEDAYELHGELPGLDRNNANIEFTDHKTIVIKGRVERQYTSGSSPESAPAVETATPAASTHADETSSKHAYVSDEEDEDWVKEKGTDAEVAKTPSREASPEQARPVSQKNSTDKYCVFERSVGEFSRTFRFSTPIDQNGTTARLENGILSVTVPKSKKREVRSISIN